MATSRFSFTDEQQQFRDVLRRYFLRHSPSRRVRELMATDAGYDAGDWRRLADELALPGLAIPETYGGAGFGAVEVAIALEEMGRALVCVPYFSSAVLAGQALLTSGDADSCARYLPAIASGDCVATLALAEAAGDWTCSGIEACARKVGDGFVIDGTKHFVIDGAHADLVLVAARLPGSEGVDGVSLFAVPGDATGLSRRTLDTIDETRKLAALNFEAVSAQPIGRVGAAAAGLERTLDYAAIALANEQVGGAGALLESALDYAKLRMQFGRPIGSFQAIKHRLADLLLDVELAKAAAYYAAAALADDAADVPALAALAQATASDTYMRTAEQCIQIHGGIGFTWDHDTHLWFKRAKSSEVLFGDASFHRERYLARVAA